MANLKLSTPVAQLALLPELPEVPAGSLRVIAPPLTAFKFGDRVRFSLFCFGAERPASGEVIPASEFSTAMRGAIEITGTVCIRYSCQLPAIETLDPIYHEVYPDDRLWQGIVQMPAAEVQLSSLEYCSGDDDLLSPEQRSIATVAERSRRYSAKGHACGWIEERLGNLQRKNPSTSYFYCWQDGETRGKQYVPVRKMAAVQQMLSDRRSVDEILAALRK